MPALDGERYRHLQWLVAEPNPRLPTALSTVAYILQPASCGPFCSSSSWTSTAGLWGRSLRGPPFQNDDERPALQPYDEIPRHGIVGMSPLAAQQRQPAADEPEGILRAIGSVVEVTGLLCQS
ncbi:hypothetical protein S40293_11108 [Stachybotrys chartarum IBT 40293]|nr:hypothetical protein S40293_11108 [Stachybotrys chartarum IBT 40293]